MNSLGCVKAWIWSIVIVTGLTGSAFAQRGHGGGGHGGGGSRGGGGSMHHGGGSMHHGGGSSHSHGGYSGGSYGGRSYGGYGGYSGLRIGIGGYGSGGYGGYGYGGYPGYGYGYGGYGHGGYPGFGYGYYSTPRYYYSTPSYSYPSTVIINSAPSAPAPTFDNGPIVIIAPATNDKPIEYMLNGQPFTMKPGQSQKFNHDRDWIVDFDRGNGKGTGKYSLKATTYKFKMTDSGWELFEAAKPEPPRDSVPVAPVPMDDIK